jgi:predicted metal-dependent hydrolase
VKGDLPAQAGRHSIRYGDEVIWLTLRLQQERRLRRLSIHVEPDGKVLVDGPEGITKREFLSAVGKRARWIGEHVTAAQERMKHALPREYVSGEAIFYLGRRYQLKVIPAVKSPAEARLRGRFLEVRVPTAERDPVREAINAWYVERARDFLLQRLAEVARPLRWVKALPPTRLRFMRVQWGSCSTQGMLTLHPWLVKAPRECVDYVLLHELCHLAHHNHGPNFYRSLDRHMPNWRNVKLRLDDMVEDIFRV